jgi:hypothetical protein
LRIITLGIGGDQTDDFIIGCILQLVIGDGIIIIRGDGIVGIIMVGITIHIT